MYESVLGLHSYLAYAVLVFLLLASLNAFMGLSAKRAFTPKDRQIAMIALVFSHVQFVLGLLLIFVSPAMEAAQAGGMGAVMKDSYLRLLLIEHPLVNLIALTIITIGWSKHKRALEDSRKFKNIAFLYGIGLLLLLSRIPYNQWFD